MRNIIAGADNELVIDEFKDLKFTKIKNTDSDLSKLFPSINENEKIYLYENAEIKVFAILSNIGKYPHPIIKYAEFSAWYNSNFGGAYLVGIDKKSNQYFAPLKKQP